MRPTPFRGMLARRRLRCAALLAGCTLAWPIAAHPERAGADTLEGVSTKTAGSVSGGTAGEPRNVTAGSGGLATSASATLEQCLTTGGQTERSATLAGEMTAIPGTARMQMRINLVEKLPGETLYHLVTSPGLGAWRVSAPGVKLFTSINHVTNLSSPALYRGAVRFRWLNAKGHAIKVEELRTPRCEQPALPTTPVTTLAAR